MAQGVHWTVIQGDARLAAVAAVLSAALELGGASGSVMRRPFDPVSHELDATTFRLTKHGDLKG